MISLASVASAWPARIAPEPAGASGLALALLVVTVLTVHLFRDGGREKVSPGPVPARRASRETEWRTLYWGSTSVLVVALAVVVVDRVVVLT